MHHNSTHFVLFLNAACRSDWTKIPFADESPMAASSNKQMKDEGAWETQSTAKLATAVNSLRGDCCSATHTRARVFQWPRGSALRHHCGMRPGQPHHSGACASPPAMTAVCQSDWLTHCVNEKQNKMTGLFRHFPLRQRGLRAQLQAQAEAGRPHLRHRRTARRPERRHLAPLPTVPALHSPRLEKRRPPCSETSASGENGAR